MMGSDGLQALRIQTPFPLALFLDVTDVMRGHPGSASDPHDCVHPSTRTINPFQEVELFEQR